MYQFVDTIEKVGEPQLPSEAMRLNGEYIENQVRGYRTMHVSGREALPPELTTYEVGVRDGSRVKSRRFPSRVLTITYQLIAESNGAFRDAYNKLASVLNVEEAELIFNDENDKFFIGTPSSIESVEPGTNVVISEFQILCADPFKYSVVEYEAEQSRLEDSILLNYNGTYKAFPTLEADFYSEDGNVPGALKGKGDCGYVAFFTENEKIIQIGNPDEEDGVDTFEKSQTLLNQLFQSNTAWGTDAKALWIVNNGISLPVDVQQVGAVGMAIASYAVPANPAETYGTLINAWSDTDEPKFNYTVTAKTYGRTASAVNVALTITAALRYDGSYFGRGFSLFAYMYMEGTWHSVQVKDTSSYWRGRTGHTVNLTFTVPVASSETSSLSGIRFKVTRGDSVGGGAGILYDKPCNNLPISTYIANVPETYYLTATSYGEAEGKWHGTAITRQFPVDASGELGVRDFTFTYQQKLCIDRIDQLGAFQAQLTTLEGAHVAGLRIYKNSVGNNGTLALYLDGEEAFSMDFDLSYNNPYFGAGSNAVQTSSIVKDGDSVTFSVGGYKKTLLATTLKEKRVIKATIIFEQYSSAPALAYNGLYWVKCVKNNCTTWKDIPNKFSANDSIKADCRNGKIYLNGVHSPEYGALGNDWEEFCLSNGLNQIGFAYSSWVPNEYAPKFKVRYREVYL